MTEQTMTKGLAGVVASETELSYIDGERGRLLYRGYDIHDLASQASFEEAVYLLWNGELPDAARLEDFRGELARQRSLDAGLLAVLRNLPESTPAMAALRTAVSAMGNFDPDAEEGSREASLRIAGRLLAKIPTAIAAFHRLREGREPVTPEPSLSHAANFLYMLEDKEPSDVAARALDTSLLLYLEHGLNASTFTCRVIASTLSDPYSAITGGIGALKGSLHGGANQAAMEMLLEIGDEENVASYLDRKLAAGEKVMGFGHRVYRTEDPRATHLREMSRRLAEEGPEDRWFRISRALEREMKERKGLDCNVDFYCASVYYSLRLPLDLFTPLFAAGRVGGWMAHVLEQQAANRLIRPRAEYVGPAPREYVPLERR